MPSSLRLGALAGLLALAACDSAVEAPAFTVAAVVAGDTVATASAAPAASLADVPVATVRLAPRLGEPADPALRDRYEATRIVVAALNAASGETYEVGHYLVETEADAGAALVTAPVACDALGQFTVTPGDGRLDAPGAVFFPVAEGAEVGPPLVFRPFGIGGAARLAFEGDGDTATVEAAAFGVAPTLRVAADEVELRRGASTADVTLVVRRGAAVSALFVDPLTSRVGTPLPEGDGPAELYLLEAAGDDSEAPCPGA